jgi:hypothetical protein
MDILKIERSGSFEQPEKAKRTTHASSSLEKKEWEQVGIKKLGACCIYQ